MTYLAVPDLGIVDVYVDGAKIASLNEYSPTWDWQTTWTGDLLPPGDHSLRIIHVSGSKVNIDALSVMP